MTDQTGIDQSQGQASQETVRGSGSAACVIQYYYLVPRGYFNFIEERTTTRHQVDCLSDRSEVKITLHAERKHGNGSWIGGDRADQLVFIVASRNTVSLVNTHLILFRNDGDFSLDTKLTSASAQFHKGQCDRVGFLQHIVSGSCNTVTVVVALSPMVLVTVRRNTRGSAELISWKGITKEA